MASRSRHHWKKKESLLGFYSIMFLHFIIPTTAAPFYQATAKKSTIEPLQTMKATAAMQAQTTSEENPEMRQNNNVSDNIADSIQKIRGDQSDKMQNLPPSKTKRSIDVSKFPFDFPSFYQNQKQDSNPKIKSCNGGLCPGKLQILDNQDYDNTKFLDDEDYADSADRNMSPYETKLLNTGNVQYYRPAEDDISDTYTLTHRTIPTHDYSSNQPKIVILALPKISSSDQDQQSNSKDDSELLHEVKKNIFTSRGWGAGGMPFSVLYLHQQQHLKPAARSPIAGAQQLIAPPAPLRGFPSQYRQVAVRNALSSALTSANNGGGGGGSGTPLPTRRQYSIIPQLYVSYGWGPHGK